MKVILAIIVSVFSASANSATSAEISGQPILAQYAAQFSNCDTNNTFNDRKMTDYRACAGDPNNLQGFEQLSNGAIRFVSKLSLDIDGGWLACYKPGETDQCPTTYVYPDWRSKSSSKQLGNWASAFINSDRVPYVVIPYASNHPNLSIRGKESREFRDLTGISIGDVGVVLYGNKIIPVLVADGGPHNKIGEGSLALFDALGETRCTRRLQNDPRFCTRFADYSLSDTVTTILFPNSKIVNLAYATTNFQVSDRALKLYNALLNN